MVGEIKSHGIGRCPHIIRDASEAARRQEAGPVVAETGAVLFTQIQQVFDILGGKRTETVFRDFGFENREVGHFESSRGHVGGRFDVKRGRDFVNHTVAAHEVGHLSPGCTRLSEGIIIDIELTVDILEFDIGGFGKRCKHIGSTGRRRSIGNYYTTGSV